MNSYCIVFGTQSLVNALAAGSTREDVAAAACHSVAEQVFEQQLQEVDIREPVIMVGGTSLIEGLVFAMGESAPVEDCCPPPFPIYWGCGVCAACIRVYQGIRCMPLSTLKWSVPNR